VNTAYFILLEKYYKMTVSMRVRWEGHVANMGGKRNKHKDLARKPAWKDDFGDLGIDGNRSVVWIRLAQGRFSHLVVVNTAS
jgi:hypothetical protein